MFPESQSRTPALYCFKICLGSIRRRSAYLIGETVYFFPSLAKHALFSPICRTSAGVLQKRRQRVGHTQLIRYFGLEPLHRSESVQADEPAELLVVLAQPVKQISGGSHSTRVWASRLEAGAHKARTHLQLYRQRVQGKRPNRITVKKERVRELDE